MTDFINDVYQILYWPVWWLLFIGCGAIVPAILWLGMTSD